MESPDQTANRTDALERLHEQLQDSLQDLVTSEDWQQALALAARFHDYSFANTRLIWTQSLARGFTPSRVAGYRAWQELGRHVRQGERGLQILAPVIRKVEPENPEEEKRRLAGFRVVHVFDLAQTEGEPLPEVSVALVEGDLPATWDRVEELITGSGFAVKVTDIDRLGDANGITDWTRREVVVRASLPGAQRFKTAVHELAHIRLHQPDSESRPNCRGIVEVEAESVAYMVCAALGIDSAGYSLPYVASWSGGDLDKVSATAGRVIGCAREVTTELDFPRGLEHDPVAARKTMRIESRDRQVWEMAVEPALLLDRRAELEDVLRLSMSFYQRQLHEPLGAGASDYLTHRGFTEETARCWQLGYAPQSWDALTGALSREGFGEEVMLGAGVVGRARTGRLYDLMRGRVMFPILNEDGIPCGFAGRLVSGDGPKYLNGPETALYTKRSLLYGLHLAKPAIAKADQAVIVEGYTDAIAAHQADLTNVVATGGTALTSQHLDTLSRITSNVILAFDGDQAGLLAANRTVELDPTDARIRVLVARLSEGRDPADLLASGGHLFGEALAAAVPLEYHLIDQIVRQHNLEEPEAVARAIRAAGKVATTIADPKGRALAFRYLATQIDRDEAVIRTHLGDYGSSPRRLRISEHGRSIS